MLKKRNVVNVRVSIGVGVGEIKHYDVIRTNNFL